MSPHLLYCPYPPLKRYESPSLQGGLKIQLSSPGGVIMFCVPVMSVPSVITEFLSSLSYFHKPELKHLAHYLTGLLTLMNKTCRGISSMVYDAKHPSSLSRFFSRGKWESEEVNSLRLSMEKSRLSDENPRFGTLIKGGDV